MATLDRLAGGVNNRYLCSAGLECNQYAMWRVTHSYIHGRRMRHLHYCDEHLPKKYAALAAKGMELAKQEGIA